MAAHRIACLGLNALYSTVCAPQQALRTCWGAVEQVRGYYVDWRMLRDLKRRQMAFDYADERLRINALRKNTVLPKELQVNQLEADLQELGSLLEKSERKRVQELLKQEQKKVEKELAGKRQQKEQQARRAADPSAASKATYTVKITNYAWDQSEKFIKIYLTLKDVHKIPSENVEVSFTEGSFSVLIKDLGGKNHQMTVLNLLYPIDEKDSYKKIKTDMVLVMCKKQTTKKWECLTKAEKQSKDKEKPNVDESADPSDGLMTMLKKIYSEGDDEMKRTINKAWSESQEKKIRGEGGMMDF
ncbi:Calcyclin-binding protein [Nibea albiflora]|uniref:Calcyclin-binding protein n=1 Tax=Nibea albiflora TaxID=240163 RepID=A0ACB7FLZ6_NIBAL|nr:Calcyclin-binding protein [Nibea albiflora]